MDTWIKKLAEDISETTVEPVEQEKSTHLSLVVAAPDVDMQKLYKLLTSNGFPVMDIRLSNTEEEIPQVSEGDRVETTASVVLGTGIKIKTPTTLYTVASVVLPAGQLGEVVGVEKNAATVRFDANIRVEASDRSGYLDYVDYFVDNAEIPLANLKTL